MRRYNPHMTAIAEKIAREISALSPEEMLDLYAHLLQVIYTKEDKEELDPAFRDEIARRIAEIDSGRVPGINAFEALKRM